MESSTDTVQSATKDDLRARVLGSFDNFSERPPEEGENWESWFSAAFDLAREKIGSLFDRYDTTLQSELTRAREREKELVEALKSAQTVIEQAMQCIRGETPEDCTFGEAEDHTFQKLRDADSAIARALAGGKP